MRPSWVLRTAQRRSLAHLLTTSPTRFFPVSSPSRAPPTYPTLQNLFQTHFKCVDGELLGDEQKEAAVQPLLSRLRDALFKTLYE